MLMNWSYFVSHYVAQRRREPGGRAAGISQDKPFREPEIIRFWDQKLLEKSVNVSHFGLKLTRSPPCLSFREPGATCEALSIGYRVNDLSAPCLAFCEPEENCKVFSFTPPIPNIGLIPGCVTFLVS
jgi:hypothetical protein